MAYLIANANIFDGTGREPFRGAVRVEAERITAVIPGPDAPDAAGAIVIDGRGATLMPGLIESHAHLGLADMSSQDLNRAPDRGADAHHGAQCADDARLRLHERVLGRVGEAAPGHRAAPGDRGGTRGRAPAPRQWPGDHGDGRARRYESDAPASLRDADVLVGRGRARRDPPGVPAARAGGRGPLEAQPLRRHRDVELSLRADPDDGRRGRGRDGGGARGELARRRALQERGVGHARLAPRHRGHLSRQLRGRARPRRAGGGARPDLRRARARPHL